MVDHSLAAFLLIWLLAAAGLTAGRLRHKTASVGLVLAYVLNLWLIHWVAPALYLLPWHQGFDPGIVKAGLEQSTYGVLTFAFGSLVLAPCLLSFGILPQPRRPLDVQEHLPLGYVAIGTISYALVSGSLGSVPSASAIFSTGQQLVVVGIALCCWQAWRHGDNRKLLLWIAAACLLPFVTIITRGFIGYGTVATLMVLVFVARFIRNRPAVVAASFLLIYVGLSVFVTYMRDRNDIRDVVWGGQAMQARLTQLEATLTNFEWFDPSSQTHLRFIDTRLNQSFLAGLAVVRLSDNDAYAYGRTLWDAVVAFIPRAVWPEKPVTAGSGNLVSEYTGLRFAAGTSVGIGQVMEFYVNFGTVGVLVGFALMGLIVTIMDVAAAERLAKGNLHGFVLWFLPGISLLQVGGSMVEVAASAVAGVAVAVVSSAILNRVNRTAQAVGAHQVPTAVRSRYVG
jgi:hypothetical protein